MKKIGVFSGITVFPAVIILLAWLAPIERSCAQQYQRSNLEAMAMIRSGPFIIGSEEMEEEAPPHRVFTRTFYIGRFEVTNSMYQRFLESTKNVDTLFIPKSFPETGSWPEVAEEKPDHPVVGVSWRAALAYCAYKNRISRIRNPALGYRLPTEAEWEKAARGGTQLVYPWGYEWEEGMCNHGILRAGGSFYGGDGFLFTCPVDSYEAQSGRYRLHNMAGNVAEWCMDRYGSAYYQLMSGFNPKGPTSGRYRVVRGGSYRMNPINLRTSSRQGYPPASRLPFIGFRLARSARSARR